MKKVLFAVFAFVCLLGVFTPAQAQSRAEIERNPAFQAYIAEIVQINPQIPDFYTMLPGTQYRLPDGTVDALAIGDIQGIYGRELNKKLGPVWYTGNTAMIQGTPQGITPADLKNELDARDDRLMAAIADNTRFPWWGVLLVYLLAMAVLLLLMYARSVAREDNVRREQQDQIDNARLQQVMMQQATIVAGRDVTAAQHQHIQDLRMHNEVLREMHEEAMFNRSLGNGLGSGDPTVINNITVGANAQNVSIGGNVAMNTPGVPHEPNMVRDRQTA